jgi:hypothetical protein
VNESKVVNDNGQPLVVYHDAQRPDRIGDDFRAERATSGPMQFFADDGLNALELGAFVKPLEELNAKHVDDANPVDARGRAVIAVALPAFAEITRPGENRSARTAALERASAEVMLVAESAVLEKPERAFVITHGLGATSYGIRPINA